MAIAGRAISTTGCILTHCIEVPAVSCRAFGGIVAIVLDRPEASIPSPLVIESSGVVPTSLLAAPPCQRAWVEIDLAALNDNIRQLRQHLQPQTALLAVVKADAYGHGAAAVARTAIAAGAQWLAVATLAEGVSLRQAQIEAPILVLGAIQTAAEVEAAVAWQLQPTLCDRAQIDLFTRTLAQLDRGISVHVQLDTGMSRLGMPWQEAVPFIRDIQRHPEIQIAGLFSHLATADDPDPTVAEQQQQHFATAIAAIERELAFTPPLLHLANSAATLSRPAWHYDMVRVGLSLYGLYPAPHLRETVPLQPVLQVKARVTQVKQIPAGAGVSYGHRFIADRPLSIAVVGIGYADGVPRNLSGRLEVLARGRRLQQIGTITMDQLMLDASPLPDLAVGEAITLIGRDGSEAIAAEDWATQLGTISWEVLCGFKHRLPRIAIGVPAIGERAG